MTRRKIAKPEPVPPRDPRDARVWLVEYMTRIIAKVAERTATRDALAVDLMALLGTDGGREYVRSCCTVAPQWAHAVDLLDSARDELIACEEHLAELDAEIAASGVPQ